MLLYDRAIRRDLFVLDRRGKMLSNRNHECRIFHDDGKVGFDYSEHN
jgi:hypothetical protein